MELEKEFVYKIRKYSDENIGKKILFTAFTNLEFQNHDISPKDLASLTSKIINNLIKQKIIIEIPKSKEFDIPYGMYEILPHERLINLND